ncbi:MAG: PspC domain-containing protein [Acidobacteriota bacterium]
MEAIKPARAPFRRRRSGKILGGVCSAAAHRYGWPVGRVRVVWFLCAAVPVLPGLPAYLLLWLLTPLE